MAVDLALLDPEASLDEQARQLANACETIGFFRLPLDVIDRDVADAAWNSASAFFALDEATKRQVTFPEPGYPYGYSPYRFETLANSIDQDGSAPGAAAGLGGPDLKESFSAGPDCLGPRLGARAGVDEGEAWIRSPTPWPDEPVELRPSWEAYYRALSTLADRLHEVMAVALDLPSDYFVPLIDRPITSMRAIRYPTFEPDAKGGPSLRAGAHADYGTLTILRTDEVAGLEIRTADGEWQAATPQPDTFVVNLGDSIAQWTNDRWRSTMHRVALTDPAERQSFAFFHMANWDAVIECLPTCLSPGETPKHPPTAAGPWLMRKFQATVN